MPKRKRGRPYVYFLTAILRCFIARLWFLLHSNNGLRIFLNIDCPYNHKQVLTCGLVSIPSRRTFDRRLKTISTDIKQRISTMGHLFVTERLVMVDDHSITAIDSTLLKAKGSIWHKSFMEKRIVLVRVLIQMQDGAIVIQGWIFGYKLHLTSIAGELVIPLTADVTTANIPNNRMYIPLTSSHSHSPFSIFSLPFVLYMIADPGYDDKKLYKYIKNVLGIDLVCTVEIFESTSKERLELVCFYQSALGQAIYSQRSISVEPLIDHIKSIFRIDPFPACGIHAVSAIVLL